MKSVLKYMVCAISATALLTGCVKETFPMGSSATQEQVSNSPFASSGLGALDPIPTAMITTYISDYQNDFGYPSMMIALDHLSGDLFPTNAYRG